MIPEFGADGNLPPGIYKADWAEITSRFGETKVRKRLLAGLLLALQQLKLAGCRRVLLDGSFVTSKANPGDYDACWDGFGVDVGLLDPVFGRFENGRAAQKLKYGGEFFPSLAQADATRVFIDFFQSDRDTGAAKGIIAINLESVP